MNETQIERALNQREQNMAIEIYELRRERDATQARFIAMRDSVHTCPTCKRNYIGQTCSLCERDAARLELVQARDLVSACDVPHKLARMKRLFKCANRKKRAAQRERNAAQARSGAKSEIQNE